MGSRAMVRLTYSSSARWHFTAVASFRYNARVPAWKLRFAPGDVALAATKPIIERESRSRAQTMAAT